MGDWHAINDEFYEENGDKFVVAWWNGISIGSGGRQQCRFLTAETRAFGPQYALASQWVDWGQQFDDEASAEAFKQKQQEIRPGAYENWFVTKIGDLEKITGYRPATEAALIGDGPSFAAKP